MHLRENYWIPITNCNLLILFPEKDLCLFCVYVNPFTFSV
jgi:hypothetical protein